MTDEPRRPGVYFPDPPADPVPLDAKHRLADVLRALNELCTTVDPVAAGADELDAVTELVEEARKRLAELPTLDFGRWGTETAIAERGPFAGLGNPIAAPLRLELDGATTRGSAVYGHTYEGGVGDLHGGVVAGAFDDLLGCAQLVGPVSGRTGTLVVRYRAPSPVGRRIDYEARVERVDGRKSFCSGEARCGDVLLAEAEAIFVAPRESTSTGRG